MNRMGQGRNTVIQLNSWLLGDTGDRDVVSNLCFYLYFSIWRLCHGWHSLLSKLLFSTIHWLSNYYKLPTNSLQQNWLSAWMLNWFYILATPTHFTQKVVNNSTVTNNRTKQDNTVSSMNFCLFDIYSCRCSSTAFPTAQVNLLLNKLIYKKYIS